MKYVEILQWHRRNKRRPLSLVITGDVDKKEIEAATE